MELIFYKNEISLMYISYIVKVATEKCRYCATKLLNKF